MPFPLLLKVIDAEPKTEMWYILDHQKDAEIMVDVRGEVTKEQLLKKITDPSIRDLMCSIRTEKGQAHLIKALTMHSIGRGNLIYEVQQNSNTTYRVSDWGRVDKSGKPRQLHVEQALKCFEKSHQNNTNSIYT